MGDVRGMRVLVVGASKGLGRAVATRLDHDGASLVIASRRTDLLDELAADCGTRPVVVTGDVSRPDECDAMVAAAVARFGGLDAVVPDPDRLAAFTEEWRARGYLAPVQLGPEDQASLVVHVLSSPASIDVVWSRPPGMFQLPAPGTGPLPH